MGKYISILILFFVCCGAGYNGTLPNIKKEFEYKTNQPEVAVPIFGVQQKDENYELKKIPRDNQKYVEIIIKKDKSSQYSNDTNAVITLLEKLRTCLIKQDNIQQFNAIVSNLIDHITLIQEEYKNKPESSYISYKALQSLSQQARSAAVLRTESQVYSQYLPYSSSGKAYKPQNIQKQLDSLANTVDQTLYILKNLD